jgi:hypothetical protein
MRRLHKVHEIIKGHKAEYPELESEYALLEHKLFNEREYKQWDNDGRCSCHMCRPNPDDRDTKKNRLERVLDKEMKEDILQSI